MVTFLFSVHTITEAKQYAGLGRAEPGLEPGHLTWCSPQKTPMNRSAPDLAQRVASPT